MSNFVHKRDRTHPPLIKCNYSPLNPKEMKTRITPILFALTALLCSCIDERYDLSKITSSEIAIGNDESEFLMPLAQITIPIDRLVSENEAGAENIIELYGEACIWIPAIPPNGVEFLEVPRLSEDEAYLASVLEALFEEMRADESKRMEVCTLTASSYREEFISTLSASLPQAILNPLLNTSDEEAARLIADLFMQNEWQKEVFDSIGELARDYICNMQLDDVIYEIPQLQISSEVEQMLRNNLDPIEIEDAVNALYLFGTIESELPLQLQSSPYFEQTTIHFDTLHIGDQATNFDQIRLSAEDLDRLFEGARLHIPLLLEKVYPRREINLQQKIRLSISLRKTGSLTL